MCFRWRDQSATPISAMPIGMPGWPEFACWTASIASARIALAIRVVEAGDEVVMSSPENESRKRGHGGSGSSSVNRSRRAVRRLTDAKRTEPTDGAAKLDILTDGLTFPLSARGVPARFSAEPHASYNSGVGTARPERPAREHDPSLPSHARRRVRLPERTPARARRVAAPAHRSLGNPAARPPVHAGRTADDVGRRRIRVPRVHDAPGRAHASVPAQGARARRRRRRRGAPAAQARVHRADRRRRTRR
ncbi:hypothetical protein BDI4_1510004 [Burkholderia diffusa]|nr:hypothetical protein BDI4_1510004 [Burkholderia diffusa]